MLQAYDEQLWATLERVLLAPLCQHIESGLRLHHHAALLTGVPPINPNSADVLNVTPLLQVPALQLFTRLVNIRYVPPGVGASLLIVALSPACMPVRPDHISGLAHLSLSCLLLDASVCSRFWLSANTLLSLGAAVDQSGSTVVDSVVIPLMFKDTCSVEPQMLFRAMRS